MNRWQSSTERLKFDVRMLDLNLKNRNLTKSELESRLKSLPDLSDRTTKVNFHHGSKENGHDPSHSNY